jgi:hypothetical protein
MATVGEIVIDVTADVGPLVRQMNKAEGALGGLQGAASRMGSGLSRAGSMAVSFGKNMAVVAAGVAAVTGAAIAFARSSAAFGDAIGDASKAAGMSTTAFQEYRFALKEAADMTDEDFASAAAKLNKTLGEARQGSLSAIKAFQEIGVSQAELAASTFNTDQAMAAYVATMEGMKDPTLAAAVSADLFGKAGATMGASLSGVPGQVGSLVDRARELGVVLGPEAVAAASQFDQKMKELTASFEVLKMKLANDLMPVLVNSVLPAIEQYVIPALETLGGAIAGATELIVIFAEGASQAFTDFKAAAEPALQWVGDKFTWLMGIMDGFLAKIKSMAQSVTEFFSVSQEEINGMDFGGAQGLGFGQGSTGGLDVGGGQVGGTMGGGSMGAAIVNGAFIGAVQAMDEKREAFAALFAQIPQIARDTLGIQSPSTVFAEVGNNIGLGLAQGIEASNGIVAQAVSAMGAGAVTATDGMVNDILGGLDTLLAGSKKGGAALALVNTMIGASEEIKKGTFGFATAAAVIAKGMAFVAAIKGADSGSRGRGGSSAGAGAGAAPAQQPVQTLNFNITNDPFGFGDRIVRQIAMQLNEASRNGSNLRATVGA